MRQTKHQLSGINILVLRGTDNVIINVFFFMLKTAARDLGVVFDDKLSFHAHYEDITSRCFKLLCFIFRITKDFSSPHSLLYLFNSLVEARGAIGSFLQTFITFGFLLVYTSGPFIGYSGIAYVSLGFAVIFFVGMFLMPETPTYYFIQNDPKSAAKSLAKIRGKPIESLQKELDLISAAVDDSKDRKGTIADIFRRKNFKAFFIGSALVFFQQFTGITIVVFYMTDIFRVAGSNLEPAYATIIVGAVQFLAALMTPFVADRLGRRIIVMVSSGGCAIGLGLLGLYFFLADIDSPIIESINFLPLVSLMLFLVMFRWGMGALPWAIIGEMTPIEVKDSVAPLATAFCWTCSFLITRYYSVVAASAGHFVVFWIFAVCSFGSFCFGLFYLPETKDKTFNEIQDMLSGSDLTKREAERTERAQRA
ncbi:hypothetical protein ABMA27_009622 [Loxostege sticticalis]|uniref:Major facilitator superfamily (MFS) profile domain-containing protein n=1 Tax=Loxostege sticticalis TaxID=481309 RepID=A0ABR3H8K7_LOXSC